VTDKQELIDGIPDPAIRAHLDDLTEEQFAQFCRFALQIDAGELRRVTLADGSGVLVDGDCTLTDEEIRAEAAQ
jgi:hypothetical protein